MKRNFLIFVLVFLCIYTAWKFISLQLGNNIASYNAQLQMKNLSKNEFISLLSDDWYLVSIKNKDKTIQPLPDHKPVMTLEDNKIKIDFKCTQLYEIYLDKVASEGQIQFPAKNGPTPAIACLPGEAMTFQQNTFRFIGVRGNKAIPYFKDNKIELHIPNRNTIILFEKVN